jgi:2,3-bisphosphoglycerate-dependent phosphoglycerate mutase
MSTYFYFIRHGKTDWNAKRIFQGQTNIPLNKEGKEQAAQLAQFLQHEAIDVWYSSPLSRAKKTAITVIKKHKGKKCLFDKRLMEQNFGVLEGKSVDEITQQYSNTLWERPYLQIPNGERTIDVYERMKTFVLEKIDQHKNKKIAVVAHGIAIRMALSYLLDISIIDIRRYGMTNAAVTVVEIDQKGTSILHAFNKS